MVSRYELISFVGSTPDLRLNLKKGVSFTGIIADSIRLARLVTPRDPTEENGDGNSISSVHPSGGNRLGMVRAAQYRERTNLD